MKFKKVLLRPLILFGLTFSVNVLSQNVDSAAAAVAEPTMIQLKLCRRESLRNLMKK